MQGLLMKFFDQTTKLYDKNLAVFLETFDESLWHVTSADQFISLNTFDTREEAVSFCRALDLQITAIVRYK